jgi:hypothetical protein
MTDEIPMDCHPAGPEYDPILKGLQALFLANNNIPTVALIAVTANVLGQIIVRTAVSDQSIDKGVETVKRNLLEGIRFAIQEIMKASPANDA